MAKHNQTALQIQAEITTDQQWRDLLNHPGLLCIDVYSSWCGPCIAMVSTLKKIKVETTGDLLKLAVAENDNIEALKRFRDRSEPVWMFLQAGKFVNLTFGSDSANLKKILLKELKRISEQEPPDWELEPEDSSPLEDKFEFDWKKQFERQKSMQEEDKKKRKYEEYMEQMTAELCEETALVIFPRIFKDDHGEERDKEQSPPYLELMYRVLPDKFDILEQIRVKLTEEMIKMFESSSLTEKLTSRFLEGESVVLRLKARPPPPDWPVPYPFISQDKRCVRAIDDAENFLKYVVQDAVTGRDDKRMSFVERYSFVEDEEILPPVWFPEDAKCKVMVFKTIFGAYMDKAHVYKPTKEAKRVVFKFESAKFGIIEDYCRDFEDAVDFFGVFGEEIVVVMRKVSDKAFLAFAGSYPIFMEDNIVGVSKIVEEYFPDIQDEEEEEEDEDEGEEEEEEDDGYELSD